MKMEGKLLGDIQYKNGYAQYKMLSKNQKEYDVISAGEQAGLDALFLRDGQSVQLECEVSTNLMINRKGTIQIKTTRGEQR